MVVNDKWEGCFITFSWKVWNGSILNVAHCCCCVCLYCFIFNRHVSFSQIRRKRNKENSFVDEFLFTRTLLWFSCFVSYYYLYSLISCFILCRYFQIWYVISLRYVLYTQKTFLNVLCSDAAIFCFYSFTQTVVQKTEIVFMVLGLSL